MGRPHVAVLLLAALLKGAAGCNLTAVQICSQVATLAQAQCEAAPDKLQCCTGAAVLESCIITNGGAACGTPEPAQIAAANQQISAYRTYLTGVHGYECADGMGTPTTTVPLVSGDSGSASGSGRSALSGSPSGFMTWQWVFFGLFLCCCVAGVGGGGAYALMGKKKKRGNAKGGRPYDDDMPSLVPIEQEMPPMIDDSQQDMMQAPLYQQPPPMEEADQQTVEVEPLLFGPGPGLLPGPTNSSVVTGPQYSYPAGVPQTTSEYTSGYYQPAQPMTTSNYTTGYQQQYQVATPTTMSQYGAPAMGYAAQAPMGYATQAPMMYAEAAPAYGTGSYYTGGGPQYATTAYAGGPQYSAGGAI